MTTNPPTPKALEDLLKMICECGESNKVVESGDKITVRCDCRKFIFEGVANGMNVIQAIKKDAEPKKLDKDCKHISTQSHWIDNHTKYVKDCNECGGRL